MNKRQRIEIYNKYQGHCAYCGEEIDYKQMQVDHHVPIEDREKIFNEIYRILKPEGVFILCEMNMINPLFRFYLNYIFPKIKMIDEGKENWIRPDKLPGIKGGCWKEDIIYFSFLPDFLPEFLHKWLDKFERYLERSRLKKYSIHYIAIWERYAIN